MLAASSWCNFRVLRILSTPGLAFRQAAPAPRGAPHQDESIATRATATTACGPAFASLGPLAKRVLTTAALVAVLASTAVYVGEVAGGAGGGEGLVAPAFAELEPLPLKSYSEEFSSGLAPVNTVRGKR